MPPPSAPARSPAVSPPPPALGTPPSSPRSSPPRRTPTTSQRSPTRASSLTSSTSSWTRSNRTAQRCEPPGRSRPQHRRSVISASTVRASASPANSSALGATAQNARLGPRRGRAVQSHRQRLNARRMPTVVITTRVEWGRTARPPATSGPTLCTLIWRGRGLPPPRSAARRAADLGGILASDASGRDARHLLSRIPPSLSAPAPTARSALLLTSPIAYR